MSDPLRPRTDPSTLREVDVDAAAVETRAAALDGETSAAALAERARALVLLGRVEEAEDCARGAADSADSAGDVPGVARARVVLGDVLARRSAFDEADNEFAVALAEAAQLHDVELRALALQYRGLSRFDAGRTAEAERDFTAALATRRRLGGSGEDVAELEQAVSAAMRRLVAARADVTWAE